jgi:hypothetical protein
MSSCVNLVFSDYAKTIFDPSGHYLACTWFLATQTVSSSLSLPSAFSELPGQLGLSANLGPSHYVVIVLFGVGSAEAL